METRSAQGTAVPALGLGTYRLRGRTCVRTVRDALEMGYRHLDTADYYGNHEPIGEAIASSSVDREELFLTTKLWRTDLERQAVRRTVSRSLSELDLAYVDLLLIHWPNPSVPIEETIGAMNRLQSEGTVRHVGVSNFDVEQLSAAMDASATPILTNQVEYNPYERQADLLRFCIENDVLLTAYSPLAKGDVANERTLRTIGDRYGKTSAQVALRWLLQQPRVATIPKASSRDHLRENLLVFDFDLTAAEMESVFDLQGGLPDDLRDLLFA